VDQHNIKCIIAYEGTHFLGWQKTKMGPSIEESLEHALATIGYKNGKLQAASRTDAGVHAKGQVVNFFTESMPDFRKLQTGLNGVVAEGISVLETSLERADFHPTLDVTGKEYHYELCQGPVQFPFYRHTSWHVPTLLDLEAMKTASHTLIGTHDFSSFCNEQKGQNEDKTRTVYGIDFTPLPHDRLRIRVLGNHFLYKMVRNIVGTLVDVGREKLSAEEINHILSSKDRTKAGVTAPAHGLCLYKVNYGPK
jgi:tRNA pseudouridine38-40 synthase